MDITQFKKATNAQGIPFSIAIAYMVTAAMNTVEVFRYRIENGEIVLHEWLHLYFSYLAPDKKYFKMILAETSNNMADFSIAAREKAFSQKQYFIREDTAGRSDLIFISSIPNVAFTHLSHTMPLSNKDNAIPRLSWGEYFEDNGKLLIPLNVHTHHAFVDGDHMGQYFDMLQEMLYHPVC